MSISVGFLILAFEVFVMHYDQIFSKKIMWTPVIYGVIAGLLTFWIFLVFNKLSYYLFLCLMVGSCFVGLLGLYLHNRWRFPMFLDFLLYHKSFSFEMLTAYTPLFAPSAFIAIGGLGILIAYFEGWRGS